jgi:hypothetical protein
MQVGKDMILYIQTQISTYSNHMYPCITLCTLRRVLYLRLVRMYLSIATSGFYYDIDESESDILEKNNSGGKQWIVDVYVYDDADRNDFKDGEYGAPYTFKFN